MMEAYSSESDVPAAASTASTADSSTSLSVTSAASPSSASSSDWTHQAQTWITEFSEEGCKQYGLAAKRAVELKRQMHEHSLQGWSVAQKNAQVYGQEFRNQSLPIVHHALDKVHPYVASVFTWFDRMAANMPHGRKQAVLILLGGLAVCGMMGSVVLVSHVATAIVEATPEFQTSSATTTLNLLHAPGTCPAMPLVNVTQVKPVWVAGYPGSGSEMFIEITEHITGHEAGNVYTGVGKRQKYCPRKATCKTHWPWLEEVPPQARTSDFYKQYLILLRNPRDALPSYYNHLYETRNKVQFHSTQAPESRWNSYRDKSFTRELEKWRDYVLGWKELTDYSLGAYVTYEQLLQPDTALDVLRPVAHIFRSAGLDVAADEHLYCLWHRAVKERPKNVRAGQRYRPGYTRVQQQAMVNMLNDLMEVVSDDAAFVTILQGYRDDIVTNTRILDDEADRST